VFINAKERKDDKRHVCYFKGFIQKRT